MGDGARSKARLVACTLLVLAASVFIMPVEAAGPFVVRGRVMDLDGRPIQGATITGEFSRLTATTDALGRYEIDYGLSARSEYLIAEAPGRHEDSAYSYGFTQFEPVDLVLGMRLTMSLTPAAVRTAESLSVQISVSTAWREDLCLQSSPPGSAARTNMAFSPDGTGVTGTATTTHGYTTPLPDGTYFARSWAFPCGSPNVALGFASYPFRVDSAGPVVSAQYPEPGSEVPEDRVLPSFRLTDASSPIAPVSVSLTDVTTSETISLPFTRTGSTYFPDAVQVRDGHAYVMSVSATDGIGNTSTTQWSFTGIAPVPTPTITDTAPYQYGERCEGTAAEVITGYSTDSCLSEPSAVRNGSLRLALADVHAATDTVVATAGYYFMGAGIKYTVPRTGVVEASALFSSGTGHGQLCVAALKGEKTIHAIKCAPISSTEVTFQFPVTTGQSLRIGGYLMPVCEDQGTARACSAASVALLDQVTVAFRSVP